jgi:hypothetical protein
VRERVARMARALRGYFRPRDHRADDGSAVALSDVEVRLPARLPPKRLVVEQPDVQPRPGDRVRRQDGREGGENEGDPLQKPSLRPRPLAHNPRRPTLRIRLHRVGRRASRSQRTLQLAALGPAPP